MLIECKWNESVQKAIGQIHEKKYYSKLKDYPEILLVGINYDTNTKKHTCTIHTYKNVS